MKALMIVLISLGANSAWGSDFIKEKIETISRFRGEDPVLMQAIAKVESNFNKNAVGSVGELGLFQLRPNYFKISLDMSVEEQTNVAIDLLQKLKVRCGTKFLQCWNMGTTKTRAKNFTRTRYEKKVFNEYQNILYTRNISPIKGQSFAREVFK